MLFLFIYCYLFTKIICQKFYNTNGTNSTKYFMEKIILKLMQETYCFAQNM